MVARFGFSVVCGRSMIAPTVNILMRSLVNEELCYYKIGSAAARREVCFYYKKHKCKTCAMQEFMKLIHEKTEEN